MENLARDRNDVRVRINAAHSQLQKILKDREPISHNHLQTSKDLQSQIQHISSEIVEKISRNQPEYQLVEGLKAALESHDPDDPLAPLGQKIQQLVDMRHESRKREVELEKQLQESKKTIENLEKQVEQLQWSDSQWDRVLSDNCRQVESAQGAAVSSTENEEMRKAMWSFLNAIRQKQAFSPKNLGPVLKELGIFPEQMSGERFVRQDIPTIAGINGVRHTGMEAPPMLPTIELIFKVMELLEMNKDSPSVEDYLVWVQIYIESRISETDEDPILVATVLRILTIIIKTTTSLSYAQACVAFCQLVNFAPERVVDSIISEQLERPKTLLIERASLNRLRAIRQPPSKRFWALEDGTVVDEADSATASMEAILTMAAAEDARMGIEARYELFSEIVQGARITILREDEDELIFEERVDGNVDIWTTGFSINCEDCSIFAQFRHHGPKITWRDEHSRSGSYLNQFYGSQIRQAVLSSLRR